MKRLLYFAVLLIISASCMKFPTPDKSQSGTPSLTSFSLLKANNPGLAGDIVFNLSTGENIAAPLNANVDVTSLVPSFEVSDGKVYIGDDVQTSGSSEVNFEDPVEYTIINSRGTLRCSFKVSVVPYTGLPVVEIFTVDNAAVDDKVNWIPATIKIHGLGQFDDLEKTCTIKGRGNGSWELPKKGYNVKLDEKDHVLGMKKNRRWCLIANYRDATFIRNAVSFKMGYLAENLEWTPKFEYAEYIMNGEYLGNYQITEQIKVGKNRVPIDEMDADDVQADSLSGGYLLELDGYHDLNYFVTDIYKWNINIKSPEEDVLQPEQSKYIETFFNEWEAKLKANDFSTMEEIINVPSFIDYDIVQTITNNEEYVRHSVWLYKKRNGQLYAGPLWDFDYSTYNNAEATSNRWTLWNHFLKNNSDYNKQFVARWNVLYPLYKEEIPKYMEEMREKLRTSATVANRIFPKEDVKKYAKTALNGDEELPYDKAIDKMKSVFLKRLEYLDETYQSLK